MTATNGGEVSKTNGHTKAKQMQAWKGLSQCLPARDADTEYWWQLTGRQLATLLDAAGYSVERQYEVLVFHHQWVVSGDPLIAKISLTFYADYSLGSILGPCTNSRQLQAEVEITDHS